MGKYILKRLFTAVVTTWLVATLTFFLMNMVPGGPFLAEKAVTAQAQKAMEAKYGLDKPLPEQYTTYISSALKGDLGPSLKKRGRTVTQIIGEKFPTSARIGGIAILVAMFVGIPLGAIAAYNRGKMVDNILMVLSTAGIAIPSFLSSTILMYIARLMRSSMLEVIGQDYMRTARAKGVSQFKSIFKHALRNAILPVITYLGPLLASLMTGSFIVEKIFNIPGLGSEFVGAITARDYPMIMGTTIFLATFVILMNVMVDLAYAVVDPRIKLK